MVAWLVAHARSPMFTWEYDYPHEKVRKSKFQQRHFVIILSFCKKHRCGCKRHAQILWLTALGSNGAGLRRSRSRLANGGKHPGLFTSSPSRRDQCLACLAPCINCLCPGQHTSRHGQNLRKLLRISPWSSQHTMCACLCIAMPCSLKSHKRHSDYLCLHYVLQCLNEFKLI